MFKKIFLPLILICTAVSGMAQSDIPTVDKSPLDISYYPVNYPLLKVKDKAEEPLLARVIYSRPQKNNRVLFGGLLEYGRVWRLGANEATEIEFFKDVKINHKKVKKGRYTLYCIPTETSWTIIVNSELDIWGSFAYDSTKDVARMDVPVQKLSDTVDYFSLYFEKESKNNFALLAVWDNVKVSLPISL